MHTALACGPYIDPAHPSFWVPAVLLVLMHPVAYFAFIQAFRYRVSRPIPMSFRRAAALTAARSALGILFFALGAAVVIRTQLTTWSWVYMYAERLGSWWLVGAAGAGLRGRRLVGWVISGTLINAAFDIIAIAGMFGAMFRSGPAVLIAWLYVAPIMLGMCLFIFGLHVVGRRESLRNRFAAAACRSCSYDLNGNLSGFCPECGTPIVLPA